MAKMSNKSQGGVTITPDAPGQLDLLGAFDSAARKHREQEINRVLDGCIALISPKGDSSGLNTILSKLSTNLAQAKDPLPAEDGRALILGNFLSSALFERARPIGTTFASRYWDPADGSAKIAFNRLEWQLNALVKSPGFDLAKWLESPIVIQWEQEASDFRSTHFIESVLPVIRCIAEFLRRVPDTRTISKDNLALSLAEMVTEMKRSNLYKIPENKIVIDAMAGRLEHRL